MRMQELKPCPFCYDPEPQMIIDLYNSNYQVVCIRCGASAGKCYYGQKRKLDLGGKKYPTIDDARASAVQKWNMRPQKVKIAFKENI